MAAEEEKRSRRAKRRAAEQAEAAAEPEQAEAEERAETEESDDDDADAEASRDSSDADDEAPAEERSVKRREKSKKRAEASGTEAVRDRNRRVREQAAARRRGQRDQDRGVRVGSGLDASEMVDDALARSTHAVTTWIREHFNIVQWIVLLAIVAGIGWQIYSWRRGKSDEAASDDLISGVEAELGRVGSPPDPKLAEQGMADPRPTYPDEGARLRAAEEAYRKSAEKQKGSGTAILAQLGLAGVLYDQGKYDDAKTAYEAVRRSELAVHDGDVRGRSIEGIALCLESKGDREAALKTFRELENSDIPGFGALGLYHQARLAFAAGERDKAKDLLTKVRERLDKNRTAHLPSGYLDQATVELLRAIDPKAAPAMPGNLSMQQLEQLEKQVKTNPAQLQKLLQEMGLKGGIPPEGAPSPPGNAPAPAPPEPAEQGATPPEAP